jgi:mannose-6-phosphate isomerase-like protein (cupin superfamily)
MNSCSCCGEDVDSRRAAWLVAEGKSVMCMACGEKSARMVQFTVVPMHKGHYFPAFNREDLVGINNKGGIVR